MLMTDVIVKKRDGLKLSAEGTLEPTSGASRAEISAMLYRFLHATNSI